MNRKHESIDKFQKSGVSWAWNEGCHENRFVMKKSFCSWKFFVYRGKKVVQMSCCSNACLEKGHWRDSTLMMIYFSGVLEIPEVFSTFFQCKYFEVFHCKNLKAERFYISMVKVWIDINLIKRFWNLIEAVLICITFDANLNEVLIQVKYKFKLRSILVWLNDDGYNCGFAFCRKFCSRKHKFIWD